MLQFLVHILVTGLVMFYQKVVNLANFKVQLTFIKSGVV